MPWFLLEIQLRKNNFILRKYDFLFDRQYPKGSQNFPISFLSYKRKIEIGLIQILCKLAY